MFEKKILILEDDQERTKLFKSKLREHELYIVEHAQDAIDLLKNNKFDYIFLDHDLGGKQIEYDKEDCGTVVAEYIRDNDINTRVIIHSFNSPAAQRMLKIIKNSIYIPGVWLGDLKL